MNKSIIDIEYSTAIKLFNTISHIVYSECSGKELHSLRRFIKNVDFKTLNFYSKKLNRTIQDKDITGNNYILKLDELNIIHLVFMESINKVTCFIQKPLFKNMYPHIHILAPSLGVVDNITTEDELSESRFIIIKDIFKEILMAVSDVSVKPIPKNVMFTSKPVQADEAVTVIKELSDVFANLLIANGEDEELEEKYCFIINNFTEESKDYIRLIENSNIIEYLVDNELIHV